MVETPSRALGFWNFAQAFLAAGELAAADSRNLKIPAYYLHGHALELGLKAFLKAKGWNDSQLKRVGHDLGRALEACESAGLSELLQLPSEHRDAIVPLGDYYGSKEFEYLFPGMAHLPRLDLLRGIIESLLAAIRSTCASAYDEGR